MPVQKLNRAIKYRAYPTSEQQVLFTKTFGCVRFIWNHMLIDAQQFLDEAGTFFVPTPAKYKKEFPFLKEVDEDVTCVKSMNDDYLNRQKAITEKQLSDLSSGIFLQNFDYIVYGKRLASKSENTVEFVENTIVSHNKQELEVVASGMEAMGLSVETGYYDPDDESSVDVPKQLIGFHYVVLKKNTL